MQYETKTHKIHTGKHIGKSRLEAWEWESPTERENNEMGV